MKSFNRLSWKSDRVQILCQSLGTNDPIEAILKLSKRLVAKSGQKQPPFDPAIYAKIQGVKEIIKTKLEYDARLLPLPGGYIIEISSSSSLGRQNFSCCHEVAHTFFLPRGLKLSTTHCSINLDSEIQDEEYLCNKSAAELLMPSNVFSLISLDYNPSINSIQGLAKRFNASFESTLWRLWELGTWDRYGYIAIRWKPMNPEKPENGFYIDQIRSAKGFYITPQMFKINDFGILHAYKTGEQMIERLKKGLFSESIRMGYGNSHFVFSLIYNL